MFKQNSLRANNQIRLPEVQLIDDNGKPLGVVSISEALKLAHEKDLDLVEVGPSAKPPIAKIMDLGKYLYQKERQEKKSGKKQKDSELKTVRVGFKTGQHDMDFKARQIEKFLKEGHLVKIELTLRGREKALSEMGKEKLNKFLANLQADYILQDPMKRSPFGWFVVIRHR